MPPTTGPMIDVNPGELIEARCAEVGLSVSELARRARIARSTIARWKSGTSPYLDTFRRCERILDDEAGRRQGDFWERHRGA